MFISEEAHGLLQNGRANELPSLSYRRLLSDEVRQEVLASFLYPEASLLESTAPALRDPVSLSTLNQACVVSSGHIYSRSMVDEIFSTAGHRDVICPMSRQVLIKNMAGPQRHYVLLPKIDELVENFRSFRAVTSLQRALPAIHEVHEGVQQHERLADRHAIGNIELQVSKGRVQLLLNIDRRSSICHDVLSDYFYTMLPQGRINPDWVSYSLDRSRSHFVRCWGEHGECGLLLKLGFPTADSLPRSARTFSDHHLTQILNSLLQTLAVPLAAENANPPPTYSMISLKRKVYVIALDHTQATFRQMFECAKIFLDYTKIFAEQLGFNVADIVRDGRTPATPSRVSGQGVFGLTHNVLTTTSLPSSSLRI